MLGGRAEKNKENNALRGKWTAFKVPQKPIVRTAAASAPSFEVFLDVEEECTYDGVEKRRMKPSHHHQTFYPLTMAVR
ncbi:unnamed protein product [Eruca vesicaria subsp. sativa]|uniref:Uncharacterized protein n=1 Tax=Eruca vesicaria subsp. sativa TaxID=29727 RepID=A0ABC8LU68_ERUVS|nr:unnamed protein product [Eruca vesicaria subsp. sativa]